VLLLLLPLRPDTEDEACLFVLCVLALGLLVLEVPLWLSSSKAKSRDGSFALRTAVVALPLLLLLLLLFGCLLATT
jgi:uncharacterized membrane protein